MANGKTSQLFIKVELFERNQTTFWRVMKHTNADRIMGYDDAVQTEFDLKFSELKSVVLYSNGAKYYTKLSPDEIWALLEEKTL
jgi:hypothetical protein